MGNKAECPVCEGYTSDIYRAVEDSKDCPYCGCPEEILKKWNSLRENIEELREKKIEKNILKEIKKTEQENCKLRAKINDLYSLLCGNDDPITPIKQAQNILKSHLEEEKSQKLIEVPIIWVVNLYKDKKIGQDCLREIFINNFGDSFRDELLNYVGKDYRG